VIAHFLLQRDYSLNFLIGTKNSLPCGIAYARPYKIEVENPSALRLGKTKRGASERTGGHIHGLLKNSKKKKRRLLY